MKSWVFILCASLCSVFLMAPLQAQADQWPSRTVTIVVPYPPGGSNDMIARLLADAYGTKFNQTFVVENRPGASGTVGISEVARAKADGYTLLVAANSMVTNLTAPSNVRYNVLRDFEPISMAAALPVVMVINPKIPANNVKELIELAKKDPGGLKCGSTGVGSPQQLTSQLFQSETGTKFLQVPFKGQAATVTELLGGRLEVGFITLGPALQYIQTGALKAIGILGSERNSLAPEIPTLVEQGVAGMDLGWWVGVFAPKDTDTAIVNALAEETAFLTQKDEAFQQRLQSASLIPIGSTAQEFKKSLGQEIDTWMKVAKEAEANK
ncbi:tripartite tricarboxylate transporter substrate binding protein [Alcaligenaceae bacterium]|nr:tripartite tricarboxylate transporter substrate binding protein [Alcaligenaceae bacterium]